MPAEFGGRAMRFTFSVAFLVFVVKLTSCHAFSSHAQMTIQAPRALPIGAVHPTIHGCMRQYWSYLRFRFSLACILESMKNRYLVVGKAAQRQLRVQQHGRRHPACQVLDLSYALACFLRFLCFGATSCSLPAACRLFAVSLTFACFAHSLSKRVHCWRLERALRRPFACDSLRGPLILCCS